MMNLDFKNVQNWPPAMRGAAVAVVFLAMLALGYHFDLSSLQTQLKVVINQEEDLKEQYEALIRKKIMLKQDISRLPALRAQLAQWRKSIVKHEDLAEVLNEILKLGGNNRLYISLFDPDAAVQEGDYEKLPIRMIVVGSYHQIADFLSQLANMPQLVVIGDFVISNERKNDVLGAKLAQQASQQNLLTAELKLVVYYQPDEVAPKKPSTGETKANEQPTP